MATGGTFRCPYCGATFTWYYDGQSKEESQEAARRQYEQHVMECERHTRH